MAPPPPAAGVAVEEFGPACFVQLPGVAAKGVEEEANALSGDVDADPVLAGLVNRLCVEDKCCRQLLDHRVMFMRAHDPDAGVGVALEQQVLEHVPDAV